MKRLVLVLLIASSTVYADCHLRMTTKLLRKDVFGQPTDIQRMITPDARGYQCVIRYRLNIDLEWQTIEGVGTGKTEEQACAQALDVKRGEILAEITPQSVRSDQQMVCSNLPEISVHPVRIGDVVWESETDVHSIASERAYFQYKNTQCRMFVERNAKNSNFFTYQGIICRLNTTKNSKWQVVDKY
jgi:hypothetical protein